ncbi:MAG: DUF2961 domain-containing protein [Fimbriimonadaceae bacterium]|nr:DUF2961 domain-containing protein [Chthonomonadaceae bacterium]MCO5295689.1 DUF2961 domain-containing protein [Fimbriimonadaceae bacterium]
MGPLSGIANLVDARSRRASSFDRSGGNADYVKVPAGATHTLAEIEGAGRITHLWFTISSKDPLVRRNLVLRAYWDGSHHPSVESPIGDFFGQGWGETYLFRSLPLAAAPKGGNALVCYFPMPFGNGARLTIENQGAEEVDALYFYVDYEECASVGDEVGRFHASYRQELTRPESDFGDRENEWAVLGPTPKNPTDEHNYVFAEAEGRGHFVGVNYYVNCPSPIWYGEGDDMFRVDGEPWPFSAHGTGTEDYFNQSWSPDELYMHPYFGTARAPGRGNDDALAGWLGRTHCYRFHLEDPIRFQKSLRASIEHGHANNLTLEIATVAYWYQTMPGKALPPLPSAEERVPRGVIKPADMHAWRDAWRAAKGGGALWGDR